MEEKGWTEIGKGLMLASLFYIAGVLVSFFATNPSHVEWSEEVPPIPYLGEYSDLYGLLSSNCLTVLILSLGYVTFGALTAFSLGFNGLIVGSVLREMIRENLEGAFICFLFHGPLEITSILLSSSVGFSSITAVIYGRDPFTLSKRQLVYLIKLVIYSLIIMIISSIIEYYLSIPCLLVRLNGRG